jgi:ankyrin repeat protein
LGKGVDPNSIDLSGNTILMGAAFKGDVGLVKLLLNRGALKEIESFTGFTAEQ